jgi:hypothetical protein
MERAMDLMRARPKSQIFTGDSVSALPMRMLFVFRSLESCLSRQRLRERASIKEGQEAEKRWHAGEKKEGERARKR